MARSYAQDLFEPPAQTDEKESPIFKKLRGLALEIMSDELQYPADDEQSEGDTPQSKYKKAKRNHQDRERDHRYTE